MERFLALTGIAAMIGGCWFFSAARSAIRWRIVAVGIALQVYLAMFLLRPEAVTWLLPIASAACLGLLVLRPRPDDTGTVIARFLGGLGFVTTLVTLWVVADGVVERTAVLLVAGLVWLGPVARPDLRARLRDLATIGGCVLPVVLLWTGVLPNDFLYQALNGIASGVTFLIWAAGEGAAFVFGTLADAKVSGWIFAVQVSAIVIFFSAILSVLYYIRLLPWLVALFGRVLYRSLGVSGAESLAAASNVFIGQTEAPLVVRPYLERMTRSEITALMAGGFATIAGSVFGIYLSFLEGAGFAGAGANLIAASVMSAPAAFVFAKLLVPETEESETIAGAELKGEPAATNLLDALAGGVTAGTKLAVNIAAMLLVFWAIIKMFDAGAQALSGAWHDNFGEPGTKALSFKEIYGYLFAPFALLIGTPPDDVTSVGQLLGTKTIFNEFIAYNDLGAMIAKGEISRRSALLATYALCGFANFMSIGIQIGGLSALAPSRRPDFARLALRAMIAGALACQLTACIVGMLV